MLTNIKVLEWSKLSELTKDTTFARLSQTAEEVLIHPRFSKFESFPGLVGGDINVTTNLFQPSIISWGAGSDSFYEYLIKMYAYDSQSFEKYAQRWMLAADSTIEHLASSPVDRPDLMFIGNHDERLGQTIAESGHMDCFAGGNFILAGTLLNQQKYTDFGLVNNA